MISLQDILKNSFNLYLKNFPVILKAIILPLLFAVAVFFMPLPSFVLGKTPNLQETLLFSAVMALSFLLSGWLGQVLTIVFYNSYKVQPLDFKQVAFDAIRRLPSYILVLLSQTIIIFIGFLFFIIPGVIFFTWYFFITPIFVLEGVRGWNVMRRSHTLVAGYGWKIFWRFCLASAVFYLVVMLCNQLIAAILNPVLNQGAANMALGVAGTIFLNLVTPFLSAVVVVMYDNIKSLKSSN